MLTENKKNRLYKIASLYYDQGKNQNEIAEIVGVSRPMISKLLTEAREVGIVTITVNEIKTHGEILADQIASLFGVKAFVIEGNLRDESSEFSEELKNGICRFLPLDRRFNLGISCGSTLGFFSEALATGKDLSLSGNISPLIGGIKATYKSYHTNELVRVISEHTNLKAHYFYLPALLSSSEEKYLYKSSDLFQQIDTKWQSLDVALVNISSLYAPPDLATSARFGKRLVTQKAVGRFLAHYYDINGNFIMADCDNVMQVETNNLKQINEVVALCSNSVDINAIVGALRTGLFSSLIIGEPLAEKLIELGNSKLHL